MAIRDLILRQIAHANVSGRSCIKYGKKFVKKKIEKEALRDALEVFVKDQNSICPFCGKVVDLRLGILWNGDPDYIKNNSQAPSPDRIRNGGLGYAFYDGKNNVRECHRGCNVGRKDGEENYRCLNEEWNPTAEETRFYQKRNRFYLQENFVIDISTNNDQMKNKTNKLTPGGVKAILFLIDSGYATMESIKTAVSDAYQAGNKIATGNQEIPRPKTVERFLTSLRKAGCGVEKFRMSDVADKVAKIYGGAPTYILKLAIDIVKHLPNAGLSRPEKGWYSLAE